MVRFRTGDSQGRVQSLPGQKPPRPATQNRAMGTLYLVRHGQASFGAADYDQLSELGRRQSLRLGRYWAERGLGFDAVITGSLRRHQQTWAGIAEGAGLALQPLVMPGLNEYDADAVIRCVHPQPLPRPDTPEQYRQHFRLLRDGLTQWMAGTVSPQGMPSYDGFARGVAEALTHVRGAHHGKNVLIVSSGGPIATAVGQVLGLSPEASIELNLRIRNSAVTELQFTPKRHSLLTYNTLPHLDGAEYRDWVTYA
jgi:broad specificity phosphatase PhoE